MHIFIRLHGRELIQIQASFAETVSSVLMRVIDISSNVMDDSYFAEKDYLRQLSISYGGKTLMPLRTLEESNIQKDGVLSISNTLLGGMMAVQIAYRLSYPCLHSCLHFYFQFFPCRLFKARSGSSGSTTKGTEISYDSCHGWSKWLIKFSLSMITFD